MAAELKDNNNNNENDTGKLSSNERLGVLSSSPLVAIFAVTLFAALTVKMQWFESVDRIFYDTLVRSHTIDYPDDIVLIAIDEPSLAKLGAWPWSRERHAELLTKLKLAEVVAFDIIFSEPQSASLNNRSLNASVMSADKALAEAISKYANVVLPMYIEQQYTGYAREILPLSSIAESAAGIGQVNIDFDSDGIVRGVTKAAGLGSPYWPHLTIAMLELENSLPDKRFKVEREDVSLQDSRSSTYGLEKSEFLNIRFIGPARSVFSLSYVDVLEGVVAESEFRNKTVLVGATAKGLGDNIATPLGVLSGVEFHANAYQALRTGAVITSLDENYRVLIAAGMVLLFSWALSHISPTAFLFSSLFVIVVIVFLSSLAFRVFSVWLPPVPMVAAIAFFYPLWSWRRIQIALVYLKNELALLKNQSASRVSIPTEIKSVFSELQETGLLEAVSIEPVLSKSVDGYSVWPDVLVKDKSAATVVSSDGQRFIIELLSPVSGEHAGLVLSTVLEPFNQPDDVSRNSYELVERTIHEINRAKKEANRMQWQMNQSMMRLQDAVVVVDAAGRVVYSNESLGEIFGAPLAGGESVTALHKTIGKLTWNSVLRKVMLENETVYQEIELSNGKTLLCQGAPIKIADNGLSIYVYVFTDVTRLRDLERSKNEALAFLSHDMRSPIVSQLALIEQSQRRERDGEHGDNDLLLKLAGLAERSLKYAEDFLMLSKAENLEEAQFQLVDMHGVVDVAFASVVNQANLEGINIAVQRPDEDCWILGDTQLLERALTNLLLNAVQHSGNSKEVALKLQIDSEVTVEIIDGGSGIDKDLLPQLFQPYFRTRKSKKPLNHKSQGEPENSSKNFGLGLSFVHSVVVRHGGQISVESEQGKGARFILSFPAASID